MAGIAQSVAAGAEKSRRLALEEPASTTPIENNEIAMKAIPSFGTAPVGTKWQRQGGGKLVEGYANE